MNRLLTLCTVLLLAPLRGSFAADAPATDPPQGKVCVYKQSAGLPRQMEIYFPPNHNPATAKVPGVILFHGGGWSGGHIAVLATMNPDLDDPADPQDIDTSVVAYLLFNPAFSPDDAKDEQVDALRHIKPGWAPAIVFFGTEDPWKTGWQFQDVQ